MKRSKLSLPPPYGDGNPGILETKWSQACDACGIERSLAVKYYRDIWHAYGAFGRFYHTRERLRSVTHSVPSQFVCGASRTRTHSPEIERNHGQLLLSATIPWNLLCRESHSAHRLWQLLSHRLPVGDVDNVVDCAQANVLHARWVSRKHHVQDTEASTLNVCDFLP
jgi:hypothetical protein